MNLSGLYQYEGLQTEEAIQYSIDIDPAHKIFNGHFPEQSVFPGVAMLHVLKTVLSEHSGKRCILTKARQIKFVGVILPDEIQNFTIELKYTEEEESLKVSSKAFAGEQILFKFSGSYKWLQ